MNQSTPILIVDDELAFRQMLTTLLEDAGYRVVSAANGRDALTYLCQSKTKPGLILLDVAMPVMSGWDFLRIQQQEARLSSIPVVIVTARGLSKEERNEAQAVAYLIKPLDFTTLLTIIEQYINPSLKARSVA